MRNEISEARFKLDVLDVEQIGREQIGKYGRAPRLGVHWKFYRSWESERATPNSGLKRGD